MCPWESPGSIVALDGPPRPARGLRVVENHGCAIWDVCRASFPAVDNVGTRRFDPCRSEFARGSFHRREELSTANRSLRAL